MKKIKILVVDDDALMRDALCQLLTENEDFEIVGLIGSGEEAINMCRVVSPDVVLMDILMDGVCGIEATRWIKEQNSEVKIILLSQYRKKEYVDTGIQCGIDGYILKHCATETLGEAIYSVATGRKYFRTFITEHI